MTIRKILALTSLSLCSFAVENTPTPAKVEKAKAEDVKIDSKPLSKYFSFGVRLGAYGMPKYHAIQLEALYTLNETFRLRLVGGGFYHYFNTLYFNNQSYDNVRLNLKNGGLMADWHIFKGGIRVSGGIFINKNELQLSKAGTALPNAVPAFIRNTTTIVSKFKYRWYAPYLGMGYDTPILGNSGISFSADMGFMFQGKARATTHFEGPNAGLLPQNVLDGARHESEGVINSHKWLRTIPIITFGIRYNFT
jgi:hypothetical protein